MLKSRLLPMAAAVALLGATGIGTAHAAGTTATTAAGATHATHRLAPGTVSVPAQRLSHFSHLLQTRRPTPSGHTANQTSTNWAGYAAQNSTFTTVTSSWTEPSVSCNAGGIVAFWIGLDGYGSNSVEQDGTGVDCSGGSPEAFAWWETYPANSIQSYSDAVAPGDRLTSTITDVGGGEYQMALTDQSQGWSENHTVSASGSDASAEVIAEAVTSGSSVTPLPDFGSVSFTGSTFNGGSMQASGAVAIDMTDSSGNVIASTGADDGAGDFTVSYGSSSQPPPGNGSVTVNNPGSQSSAVGAAVSLQINGTDSAGRALSYQATGLPPGLSISGSGLISGTATTAGTYTVEVTASDASGSTGSTSFTWSVGGGGGTGCGGLAAWSSTTSYAPGDQVSYNGDKWTATWYSTGAEPGAAASWDVWSDDGAC